jgi:type III secretion protein V
LLRSLVEEQVSIRNIHLVLTSALEYAELRDADAAIDGHSGAGRPSHDPAALVAFVRASAKHELRDKLARGTDTVVAYLFDQTVEHMLSQELRRLPGDEDIDRILGALRGELAYLPPTAQRPVLLTGHRSRTMLRKVVALEFPRLFVVAHGELPRDANVQPVARIALP